MPPRRGGWRRVSGAGAFLRNLMERNDDFFIGLQDDICRLLTSQPHGHLAIDQGPVIIMIENYRTGLLWKLFMSCSEIPAGLKRLGFQSPHIA